MKKCIALVLIVATILLIISCPIFFHSDMTNLDKLEGKKIINYPNWIRDKYSKYYNDCSFFIKDNSFIDLVVSHPLYLGSSDWIKCDSSNAKVILDIIPNDVIDKNYGGYFRIDLYGQYIVIYFDKLNDDGELVGKYFYNWIGNAKFKSDIDIEIPQEDDEHFLYDSYLKKSIYESVDKAIKVKITFTKINENTYKYKIDFDNENSFECEIMNSRNAMSNRTIDFDFSKRGFPVSYEINEQGNEIFLFEFLIGDTYLTEENSNNYYIFSPSGYVNSKWFIDGISLKEFNFNQKLVSFNVFGCKGENIDFADYFEIHVKSKDDVFLIFYKLDDDNQPVVVRSYSKPELQWKWSEGNDI